MVETDGYSPATAYPRGATEEAADAVAARGGRVMVMRLPQVHDTRRQGRITQHIQLARQHGRVAYIGEGKNRLPAVHVTDAVRLYALVLEKGHPGARYHAVAEEGVALRAIAEVIGAGLKLPVVSLTPAEASAYFGPFAGLAAIDLAASSAVTRQQLDWKPTGPDLLTDSSSQDAQERWSIHGSASLKLAHARRIGDGDLHGSIAALRLRVRDPRSLALLSKRMLS